MRIQSLYVANFLGLASAELQLQAPVQLFAGANGAGKSSLRDAIALALTADLGRVSLKKDAPQLIRAGAEAACCEVVDSDGDTYSVTISAAGKITDSQKGREADAMLASVLDAQRFARLDGTERRAFLYDLMGVKVDQGEIARRLEARGCHITKVHRVLPLLRAGFDAAAKQAKANATEAKGAWRAVTGETYGSAKAISWHAPVPQHDATAAKQAATELQHCDVAIEQWQQQVGKLQAEEQRRQQLQSKLPALDAYADRLERIEKKLALDKEQLDNWEADLVKTKVAAGSTPRTGLIHDLARALGDTLFFVGEKHEFLPRWQAVLAAYESEHGPVNGAAGDGKALARLPSIQQSRDLVASAVKNGQRDQVAALQARDEAESIRAELAEVFDASALAAARQQIDTLKAQRAELVKKADAFKAAKAAADAAEKKTADAQAHAEDVATWDAIGDALSPDGIPAEILAEALGPINARLAQSAADTGWPAVVIAADMAITSGGRDYRLLSESEQWRVDAVLAESISHLSGIYLLVLDRFDVLDLAGRGELLGWLDALAEAGEIATALVFGTLKALPAGLPPTIAAHWIENGQVQQLKQAA